MDTDGYTPTISFEKLLRLARKYGPEALAGQSLPSDQDSQHQVEQAVCPCVRGEPCVVEAVADELERLTEVFRQQQHELKPDSSPEGGRSLLDNPPDDTPPRQR